MLSDNEKAELQKKISDLNIELNGLKTDLNKFSSNKEDWFQKAKSVDHQIGSMISKLKDLKNKRNALTEEVKKLKASREDANAKIKTKVDDLKKLEKDKKDITKKHDIKGDPSAMKKEIDRMEFKIETEGLTFDKEKKLMKIINEKRKEYDELKKISAVFDKLHEVSKDANVFRKVADQIHREIREKADQSQKFHEEVIKLSKEIDGLRGKETESGEKFTEYRSQFNEINKKLREKLTELSELQNKLGEDRKEERKQKEDKIQLSLMEKEKLVEEKIKKGGKLTTQDLLVFQRKR